MKIRNITIENFRGIKHPLILDFTKGKNQTSVAIYGRNGNGKSSIVDSWEWLYSDSSKIEHLAREGAAEKEFPHKSSGGQNCYIHVDFVEEGDFVRQVYNPSRITQPHTSGCYEKFKDVAQHPCHLRYRDLQNFVYQTKSERYRYLAKYLGFEKRLLIQERFIAQRNKYKQHIISLRGKLEEAKFKLKQLLDLEEGSKIADIQSAANLRLSEISKRYGLDKIEDVFASDDLKALIEKQIAQDPNAVRLTRLKSYSKHLGRLKPSGFPKDEISQLNELLSNIRKEEDNLSKLILVQLYSVGVKVIDESVKICPLCDQEFSGNLSEHIENKFDKLSTLRDQKDKFIKQKQSLLSKVNGLQRFYENLNTEIDLDDENPEVNQLAVLIINSYKSVASELNLKFEEIENLEISLRFSESNSIRLQKLVAETIEKVTKEIETLEKDESRLRLANDIKFVNDIRRSYDELFRSGVSLKIMNKRSEKFTIIVDKFIDVLKSDIQDSFDKISSNVVQYFNILEASNTNITNPKITLLSDKEKAVELEIEFASEPVHPAFKVLSESQINSFGLSVFLAAIRQFNTDFKFVILDDVVNSFDSYKRPKVIDLLKTYFDDFQTLILTHDQIWYDRLQRTFPSWNRIKFTSWDYNTGPKIKPGQSIFEEIEHQLNEDNPVVAGQLLGRYLEWTLQEFNQNLESPLKYKKDNQYALNELYQAFRDRLKKKLKNNVCTDKVVSFGDKTIFRNYCAHWKGTETEFSKEEIDEIYRSWLEIDKLFKCNHCSNYVTLVRPGDYIRCRCAKTDLQSIEYKKQ